MQKILSHLHSIFRYILNLYELDHRHKNGKAHVPLPIYRLIIMVACLLQIATEVLFIEHVAHFLFNFAIIQDIPPLYAAAYLSPLIHNQIQDINNDKNNWQNMHDISTGQVKPILFMAYPFLSLFLKNP